MSEGFAYLLILSDGSLFTGKLQPDDKELSVVYIL